MQLRLTKPVRIAVDGVHGSNYQAGDVVDLPDGLASALMRDGMAELPEQSPASARAEAPEPQTPKQAEVLPTPKKKYRAPVASPLADSQE